MKRHVILTELILKTKILSFKNREINPLIIL